MDTKLSIGGTDSVPTTPLSATAPDLKFQSPEKIKAEGTRMAVLFTEPEFKCELFLHVDCGF